MSRFSEKLDALPETAELAFALDVGRLAHALRAGCNRATIAVGSGGSSIVAQYFARCRETLFGQPTEVLTPVEFALSNRDLADADLWLFSAGADNPDSIATIVASRARGAAIHIVTRNPHGAAASLAAATPTSKIFAVPVADPKDGFLATNSLLSSVLALLLASDRVSEDPVGDALRAAYRQGLAGILAPAARAVMAKRFDTLRRNDLLLLIADPQVRPVAELIETSAWEAALCPVQRTDMRNFAHGRHSWLHHRPADSFMLSLATDDTRSLWAKTAAMLPDLRSVEHDFAGAGRLRNALGIVDALVMVEAMGAAVGIDPGKPGIGDFGRALYDHDGLLDVTRGLDPATLQKRAAILHRDDHSTSGESLHAIATQRREQLARAIIGGIVLDYDGTIITDAERFGSPRAEIVEELVRLDQLGVRLAIATGRGGSGGKALRDVLPQTLHPRIAIGYYNGAHLEPLSTDIERASPEADPVLTETFAWLKDRPDLFLGAFVGRFSNVQISIKLDNLADSTTFADALNSCPPIASGSVKYAQSGHSIDFVAASTSKRRVIEHLRDQLPDGEDILCVGDSGARAGNDHEFLSHALGISVGTVCGRHEGCWSLFGPQLTGPDALLRLLRAVKRHGDGFVRIDIFDLRLDNHDEHEHI